jgi:hypothetical protein
MSFEGDAVLPFLSPKRADGAGEGLGIDVQGEPHRDRFLTIRQHIRTVSVLEREWDRMAGVPGRIDGVAFPLDAVLGCGRELQDVRLAVDFPEEIVTGVENCRLERLEFRDVGDQGVCLAYLSLLLAFRFVASSVFARTQLKRKEYNEREQEPFPPL